MNKQQVYVKPNAKGFCATFSYDDKYSTVNGWYQTFIDEDHLYGFATQPYTVRYDFKKGILQYPGNWETDPTKQIAAMKDQIAELKATNNDTQREIDESQATSKDLAKKLKQSTASNRDLSNIVMELQQQMAAANGKEAK